MTRRPAAIGFYPQKKEALKRKLREMLEKAPQRDINPRGLIVPHAGYSYSGETAAHAYKTLKDIENAIILGVNHVNLGYKAALSAQDWETPLGTVENNKEIKKQLLRNPELKVDETAHTQEHSIEVQLPFLKYLFPGITINPILLRSTVTLEEIRSIARTIEETINEKPGTVLIASSDLLHVGPRFSLFPPTGKDTLEYLEEEDGKFLEKVKSLDVEGIIDFGETSTVCGYIPISIAVESLKKEIDEVKVLHRSNSFKETGDRSNIVGYTSIALI